MSISLFAIQFILLFLIASLLPLASPLFFLSIAALTCILYFILHRRPDLLQHLHITPQQWKQLYFFMVLAILIRLLVTTPTTQYTILFLPIAGDFLFTFWEKDSEGKSINFFLVFFPLLLIIFILTLFVSPHLTFPYLLALFIMGLFLSFLNFRVFNDFSYKTPLLYLATFLSFPVLFNLLQIDIITATILSGCFAYILYLHYFLDELKGLIFLVIGVIFYIAFQWSGFLAFILMTACCFYIAFIAHEFQLSFMDSDSKFYSLTSHLLSFEMFPFLLALTALIWDRQHLTFIFYACQTFILFRLLIEILGKTYSKHGYSMPRAQKISILSSHAVSLEGLFLSLVVTVIYLLVLSFYSGLIGGPSILFISCLSVILYLVEKWTHNYLPSFPVYGYQFLSLLVIALLSGFYLLF